MDGNPVRADDSYARHTDGRTQIVTVPSVLDLGERDTYVLGVPRYGLSVVLLTNRQNLGTDERGYFPDLGPLQQAISAAIVRGAEEDATRLAR